MIQSTLMLAQATAAPGAGVEPGGVVVVGFLFVVVVLALLATVTSLMGMFFTRQTARAAEKAAQAAQAAAESSATQPVTGGSVAEPAPVPPAAGTDPQTDDPAVVAVIAAAVHSMVGDRPHRIVSVRSSGPGWAQEGRRQIFSSHRVR